MVMGPRQTGEYAERWIDCQRALEPLFLALIREQITPFIDLTLISGPIFEAAEAAGWQIKDVAAAVEELAVSHELNLSTRQGADLEAGDDPSTVHCRRV